MVSTASCTARWSILPCSTSISVEKPSIGTSLTLRMWPLLLVLRAYCMTRCWGYPPQKRPDPGRYGPFGGIVVTRPGVARAAEIVNGNSDAHDRSPLLDAAEHLAEPRAAMRRHSHRRWPRDGRGAGASRRRRG